MYKNKSLNCTPEISPADGRIHLTMDCRSTQLYYTGAKANLVTGGAN